MIPVPSNPELPSDFVDRVRDNAYPLVDYLWGPAAVGDTSSGNNTQRWTATYEGNQIVLTSNSGQRHVAHTVAGATRIAAAFDQQARPVVGWEVGGNSTFRYFNESSDVVNFELPSAERICIKLDEVSAWNVGDSDVLVAYSRDGNVYCRVQREAYATERLMGRGRLISMGRNAGNRFQFRIEKRTAPVFEVVATEVYEPSFNSTAPAVLPDHEVGDLLVVVGASQNMSAYTGDWTNFAYVPLTAQPDGSPVQMAALAKVATGSDSLTLPFGGWFRYVVFVVRGAGLSNISWAGNRSSSDSATVSGPGLGLSVVGSLGALSYTPVDWPANSTEGRLWTPNNNASNRPVIVTSHSSYSGDIDPGDFSLGGEDSYAMTVAIK